MTMAAENLTVTKNTSWRKQQADPSGGQARNARSQAKKQVLHAGIISIMGVADQPFPRQNRLDRNIAITLCCPTEPLVSRHQTIDASVRRRHP